MWDSGQENPDIYDVQLGTGMQLISLNAGPYVHTWKCIYMLV